MLCGNSNIRTPYAAQEEYIYTAMMETERQENIILSWVRTLRIHKVAWTSSGVVSCALGGVTVLARM